jgi:hypothetical protein
MMLIVFRAGSGYRIWWYGGICVQLFSQHLTIIVEIRLSSLIIHNFGDVSPVPPAGYPFWRTINRLTRGGLGHSYGGNTVLSQAALEPCIAYSVSSGALCSYAYKHAHDIPLEMALIIPRFAMRWDLHHLLECTAGWLVLIVSAEDDKYSKDACAVIARVKPKDHVVHLRERNDYAMTPERSQHIINFLTARAQQG